MEHEVDVRHGSSPTSIVQEIGDDELEALPLVHPSLFQHPARGRFLLARADRGAYVISSLKKQEDTVAGNEAGPSGDENLVVRVH
jgi:hypothetical protein